MEKRRGIRSLIPTGVLSEQAPEESIREVAISELSPSPSQPRTRMDQERLAELAESIKAHGIIQPLILRRSGKGYQVIAGERRLRAAAMAGLTRVPAVIREASDGEMLELALVENLQREDINPIEVAEAYRRLIDEFGLNQEQVAARVGKSRSAVANTLRLLNLPDPVRNSLREGKLEEGHGKILATFDDRRVVMSLWRRIVKRGLSVKQTSDMAAKLLPGNVPRGTILGGPNKWLPLGPNMQWLQDQLRERLGCRVVLKLGAKNDGVLEVHYGDPEGLQQVFDVIMNRKSIPLREALKQVEGMLRPDGKSSTDEPFDSAQGRR